MAKRVHTSAKRKPQPQQTRKHPLPRGWHEWLSEAQREAEGGKRPHGRAVVRAETPSRHAYTLQEWEKMSVEKRLRLIAEALGMLKPPAVNR